MKWWYFYSDIEITKQWPPACLWSGFLAPAFQRKNKKARIENTIKFDGSAKLSIFEFPNFMIADHPNSSSISLDPAVTFHRQIEMHNSNAEQILKATNRIRDKSEQILSILVASTGKRRSCSQSRILSEYSNQWIAFCWTEAQPSSFVTERFSLSSGSRFLGYFCRLDSRDVWCEPVSRTLSFFSPRP